MYPGARLEPSEPVAIPDYWRQLDVVSPDDLSFPITLVGAGGIGSPTALALAKMGCRDVTVYDPDVVEQHNLPNQFYRLDDVGLPKVKALRSIVHEWTGLDIVAHDERFVDAKVRGVVISAVDSMDSRRLIWLEAVRFQAGIDLYIDARMGAEVCRIYAVRPTTPEDVRFYESFLYSDDEAMNVACTAQAIIYNVFSIAGLIANAVKRYARGEEVHREIIFDHATLSMLIDY